MSNMKCPFCQQELKDQWVGQNVAHEYFDCPKCKMNGNPKLWQELIRTRKALGIAVDALKDNLSQANFTQMLDASRFHCIRTKCEFALEQITALEQKDKR